jgi:hypothetical protein
MAEEPKEVEEAVEVSDEAKREFLAKAVAAVGALAAAGLAAGVVSAAAETGPAIEGPAVAAGPLVSLAQAPLKYQKLRHGHAFELTSTELTSVLAREGLVSKDWIGKQSLMRLALLYSP